MIARLEDGSSIYVHPGKNLFGYRVVAWELDFEDFRELMRNPELLGILQTRMVPLYGDKNDA